MTTTIYFAIASLVAIMFTLAVIAGSERKLDNVDFMFTGVLAMVAGVVWPIAAPSLGLMILAKLFYQSKKSQDKGRDA